MFILRINSVLPEAKIKGIKKAPLQVPFYYFPISVFIQTIMVSRFDKMDITVIAVIIIFSLYYFIITVIYLLFLKQHCYVNQ